MIEIRRHTTGKMGTFGVLLQNEAPLCDIIEKPWLDNHPQISCIPAGTYDVVTYLSPSKGYKVWLLKNVPGREYIEIHIANFESELLGCLAPGQGYLTLQDKTGIANSGTTFKYLQSKLAESFQLRIIDMFNQQ